MLRVDEDVLGWDDSNLPSYRGEPFTGESVETALNGQVVSLSTYVDGLDEGPFRAWSYDGVLVGEGTCRRGRPIGVTRGWYDNGDPKVECEYDDQGSLLRYRSWDENGKITEDYVATQR